MKDRLERMVVAGIIRVFGAALFLVGPLPLVFAICEDIGAINRGEEPGHALFAKVLEQVQPEPKSWVN